MASILTEHYWIAFAPFILGFGFLLIFNFHLLYWILLFSITCSITLDFQSNLSTDFPTEFISIGLTILFWLSWVVRKPKHLNYLWNQRVFWGIVIMWVWSIIAAIQAVYPLIAVKYVLAKTWYISSFFIFTFYIVKSAADIKKIFWVIYIPLMLTAIYSFIRTAIGNFSFEFTNEYSLPFYDNHVIYATTMTLLLPFVFVAKKWYNKGSLIRFILNLSIPFLLIAIYFSYTRACYLALIGGFMFMLLLKIKKLLMGYVLAVLLVTSTLFLFSYDYLYLRLAPDYNTTVMHDEFKDHLISTFYGKDASSMERLNMWISVFRMYQEKPIAGYGPNNFSSTYKPYSVMYFKTWVSDNVLNLSCHNYFWLLLAEQGLVGLIIFVFFIGYVLHALQRMYNSNNSAFTAPMLLALAAVFGIFLVILFFNDLIETSKNGSLFFIYLALMVKLQQISDKNTNEHSRFF